VTGRSGIAVHDAKLSSNNLKHERMEKTYLIKVTNFCAARPAQPARPGQPARPAQPHNKTLEDALKHTTYSCSAIYTGAKLWYALHTPHRSPVSHSSARESPVQAPGEPPHASLCFPIMLSGEPPQAIWI